MILFEIKDFFFLSIQYLIKSDMALILIQFVCRQAVITIKWTMKMMMGMDGKAIESKEAPKTEEASQFT